MGIRNIIWLESRRTIVIKYYLACSSWAAKAADSETSALNFPYRSIVESTVKSQSWLICYNLVEYYLVLRIFVQLLSPL